MVNYKKTKRYGKRVMRRAGKVIKKRYSGQSGISNLVHDVSLLKQIINVEKKHVVTTGTGTFGQANSTSSYPGGIDYTNISPSIPVGTSALTRNGNSVKLTGGVLQLQIKQQSNTLNRLFYRVLLVRRVDCYQPATSASVGQSMFIENPFSPGSACLDYHSQRNTNTFSQYKIVKEIKGVLSQDQITSETAVNQISVPLKFNFHLRYSDSGTNLPISNNLYLIFLADSGIPSSSTGATWAYAMKYFYVDN